MLQQLGSALVVLGVVGATAAAQAPDTMQVEKAVRFREVQHPAAMVTAPRSAGEGVTRSIPALELGSGGQLDELGPRWRGAEQVDDLGPRFKPSSDAQLDDLGPRFKPGSDAQLDQLGPRWKWWGAEQLDELGPRWK